MAASYSNFVSQTEVDSRRKERKEQRRIERHVILKDAKENYEKAARHEERRRRTGEDSFILPGVAEQLGLGGSEGDSASLRKKHRKHKKHKKESKKKKRKLSPSASDSEHSSSEEIWVERVVSSSTTDDSGAPGPVGARQSWMKLPRVAASQTGAGPEQGAPQKEEEEEEEGGGLLQSILHRSSVRVKEVETKKKAEEKETLMSIDRPGAHPKELNPYWKEGGRGLPENVLEYRAKDQEGGTVRDGGRESGNSVVGDGGRSWLLKSYKRAVEQSESEGRSFEDIARERWGSIEELHSLLAKAGVDPRNPHRALAGLSNPVRQTRDREERGREQRRAGTSREDRYQNLSFNQPRKGHSFHRPGDAKEQRTSKHFAGLGSETVSASKDNWRKPTSRENSTSQGIKEPGSAPPTSTVRTSSAEISAEHSHETEQRPPAHGTSHTHRHSEHRQVFPRAVAEGEGGVKGEIVTDAQLNALGAKLMKAELMGNMTKVAALKSELERLRALKEKQEETPREPAVDTTLLLTQQDARGNVWPVKPPTEPRPSGGRKGKRKEYLSEGEGLSVQDMLRQERTSTAEETHRMIAKMASKFVPSSQAGEVVDDALDSKSARSYSEQKEEAGRRKDAVLQSKKMATAVENCHFCFGGKQFKKNLLISVGEKAYIALPAHQSLTEGHCFIVPQCHAPCSTSLDEDVWAEIQVFRKSLTRMFADRGLDTVFMECFRASRRHAHMSLECIPLPLDVGQLSPMYFKKAILESDEEWAQNKKLVDTRNKGIRGSIPNGLPYFAVEFGMESGFAHVIEDESLFPWYFGHEVIGGMLDLEPRMWRKPPSEPFELQKRKVLQFAEWWKAFDCTKR